MPPLLSLPFFKKKNKWFPLPPCQQGYQADSQQAGMILELHLQLRDQRSMVISSNSTHWLAFDADHVYNPTSSTHGSYDQPLEYIDAAHWQYGNDDREREREGGGGGEKKKKKRGRKKKKKKKKKRERKKREKKKEREKEKKKKTKKKK